MDRMLKRVQNLKVKKGPFAVRLCPITGITQNAERSELHASGKNHGGGRNTGVAAQHIAAGRGLRTAVIVLIFLCFEILGTNANAQQPGKSETSIAPSEKARMQIQTSGRVRAERLFQAAGIRPEKPVAISQIESRVQQILKWLAGQGYLRARVQELELPEAPGQPIRLRIDEGYPFRLGTIRLHRQDSIDVAEPLLNDLQTARSYLTLRERIGEWLTALGEKGYPFATVRVDSVFVRENREDEALYDLVLELRAGERVVIDSIEVVGNSVTRRKVIVRELPFKPGTFFRESYVKKSQQRLKQLGFFKSVSEPQLVLYDRGKGILRIEVEDGNTNQFNGVLGYNPGAGNEKGYLTGLLDLQFRNLLGTGRQISAYWEKRSRYTQELALRFMEPWVGGLPLHVEGGFRQIIQDTLYVQRDWQLQLRWPLLDRMSVVGHLARGSVSPDSSGMLLGVVASRSVSAGLGLQYSSLDDPYNPRTGAAFFTLLESIRKTADGHGAGLPGERFRQKRLSVDMQWSLPVHRRQVFFVGIHWRHVTSNEAVIALSDQFRFGGATTLRGYREEQFRGSRIAWANLEYRYLFAPLGRAFLFYDLGYYSRTEQNQKTVDSLKRGLGFGFRIETRLGILGLDYGLGEGDGPLQGKVHVSLTNRF